MKEVIKDLKRKLVGVEQSVQRSDRHRTQVKSELASACRTLNLHRLHQQELKRAIKLLEEA